MAPAKNRTTSGTKKTSSASDSSAAPAAASADPAGIRMETDGVLTPIKADFASPESAVYHDPALAGVAPATPEKIDKLEPGETLAQHEAHVLVSSPQAIAERIEKESGPDGLPTDVIVAAQAAEARSTEFQRVSGVTENDASLEGRNENKSALADALRTAADSLASPTGTSTATEPKDKSTANSPKEPTT